MQTATAGTTVTQNAVAAVLHAENSRPLTHSRECGILEGVVCCAGEELGNSDGEYQDGRFDSYKPQAQGCSPPAKHITSHRIPRIIPGDVVL